MKFLTAELVLAAVMATSSASSVPAECGADDSECNICVTARIMELGFAASSVQGPCRDVWDGSWDNDLKECIDGDCSGEEQGCIDGLQKWIDSPSVDVDALASGSTNGNICMKNGGCKAVTSMDDPLNNIGKRTSRKGVSLTDGDKALTANCVDKNDPSLITAVCVNEEDCFGYGVFGFYYQAKPASDLDEDDEDDYDDEGDYDDEDDYDNGNNEDSSVTVINHEHGVNDNLVHEDSTIATTTNFGDEVDGVSSAMSKAFGIYEFLGLIALAWAWNI